MPVVGIAIGEKLREVATVAQAQSALMERELPRSGPGLCWCFPSIRRRRLYDSSRTRSKCCSDWAAFSICDLQHLAVRYNIKFLEGAGAKC
jgi:hypothetical protein